MASAEDPLALLVLADLSVARGDHERAKRTLKDALAQADSGRSGVMKLRLDIMMKLAEITHATGEWVDSLMYLDNVYQFASEKNLTGVMCEAVLMSGTILSKKGKWDIAQRKFDQVLEILGIRSNQALMARAMVGKGTIFWRKGMGHEAIKLARKAISMVEDTENHEIMGSAQALISSAAFDMGDYPLSLECNDRALHHFRGAGNSSEITRVLNNTGETYKVMGDYPRAIDFFNEGLKMTTGTGARRNMAYLLTNLAECHIRLGKTSEAEGFISMARENAQGMQDEYLMAMLTFVGAMISERAGRADAAQQDYRAAIMKMESLDIPFDAGIMQLAYGESLLGKGESHDAANYLAAAAGSFRKSGSRSMVERAEAHLATLGKA